MSDDSDRTLDVGSGLSGLVSGGFDKLGYIPLATAVGQCEGQARARWGKYQCVISYYQIVRVILTLNKSQQITALYRRVTSLSVQLYPSLPVSGRLSKMIRNISQFVSVSILPG